ncbi:MAG TPA: hydroxyisourate hydrolase [Rhodocyclaceae bacterium]|nr:hydroxyisourate hydrolase [Rhodocyclaceae bacterium]
MNKENTRREFLTAALTVGAAAVIPERVLAQSAGGTPAGRLTLHAIDTFHGSPGGGMRIDLNIRVGEKDTYRLVKSFQTNPGGRTDQPLLSGDELVAGRYELLLHFDEYFTKRGVALPTPNFLGKVPVRFAIADVNQRYHVPVLFSPWGYSYYRGS